MVYNFGMKKKIKKSPLAIKISYDAPITLTFVLVSLFLALLNGLVLKNRLDYILLSSPTRIGGELPFDAQNISSYIKLVLYIFGSNSWGSLFSSLVFILLLGPTIEEQYGSIIIGIMILISALFAGVLNACFCTQCLRGPIAIIFMLIFLNAFISFSKKKLPLSFVLAFVLFILFIIFDQKGLDNPRTPLDLLVTIIVTVAGGLCGGLFAFLASPKSRATRKTTKVASKEKDVDIETLEEYDDRNSPRFKKKNTTAEDESTVVGTIKF